MSMYEVQIYAPEGDRVEVLLIEQDKIWLNASQSSEDESKEYHKYESPSSSRKAMPPLPKRKARRRNSGRLVCTSDGVDNVGQFSRQRSFLRTKKGSMAPGSVPRSLSFGGRRERSILMQRQTFTSSCQSRIADI